MTSTAGIRWRIAQFAEIRWWRLYLSQKDPDTYRARKTRYWQRLMALANTHPQPHQTVLDAGCGPAGIFMALADNPVTAIDPLLDQYTRDLQAVFDPAQYPHTTFIRTRLEDLQLGTFDYVFCINALNHVDDIHQALARLVGAMHDNSQLLLTIDAHNHRALQKIFKALPGDILHPHQYHLDDYIALLAQHGLEPIAPVQRLKSALIFSYYLIKAQKKHR